MAKAKRKSKVKSAEMVGLPSDDNWRARDDLHTLQRAGEISADTARMRAAKAEAARQKAALERIERLKDKKL